MYPPSAISERIAPLLRGEASVTVLGCSLVHFVESGETFSCDPYITMQGVTAYFRDVAHSVAATNNGIAYSDVSLGEVRSSALNTCRHH